jgi:hypothetical protein
LVTDLVRQWDERIKNEIALRIDIDELILGQRIDRVVAVESIIYASDSDTPTDLELCRGEKLEDGEVID